MSRVTEDDFLILIKSEIDSNRLVLPTLPDVALRVREAVTKGDASAKQLADLVATDAALSARLIQVANSPMYRGKTEIQNLQAAIARLGNTTVRTLITTLVMQQVFKPDSKLVELQFRDIWEQSVNVSAISRALASRCTHLDPDQSMLAGLIHQIGKLPILLLASRMDMALEDADMLESLLDNLHTTIGKIIMNAWDFPESLRAVPSDYREFDRNTSSDADYVDVVQVAYLEGVSNKANGTTPTDWSSIPAFAKLGLAAKIEVLEIEGIAEEIAEAQAILM